MKEAEKLNQGKHMKRKKRKLFYYLIPIVVLVAVGSVASSYILLKNNDQRQSKTEETNKRVNAGTDRPSQAEQEEGSPISSESSSNDEANNQTSEQYSKEQFRYEVPQQIQGTWYYYDTDDSLQTLTITEHDLTLTGTNAHIQHLYTEEAQNKIEAGQDYAIATTGNQKNNRNIDVPVLKVKNWNQQSVKGEAYNINYDMFDNRYLSGITSTTNAGEQMYYSSVKELQKYKQEAKDYREAEDSAGLTE